ncbi:MAG: hypothetical protein COW01_05665 [Bdellovibrionales bacterium CG12_big_fil_rev_8_21_14_0_65_38_15]|nr:MAG: hypothetical protein COW79_03560 [Bdellovibrionales bacterium CG22_combo_CG10-13_8_21_14_all_38_13]PIQ55919.1 MAG: hypothetical protein COW01_05665 [Bdellovibrionales bacterium CG12_big_fil_rev_8_21_14_0_65_38_15]PIR29630.1 MAG: hypothetical protein COV38_09355 [Bdellovibrionales bacterium CG11_big_fil_rev_8_21_14_0_20_38_13]
MSEGLLNILEEQSAMGFTGKINVLLQKNSQSFAVVLMLEGQLIHCLGANKSGEKAMLDLIFQDVSSTYDFKLVVEPEVVSAEEGIFTWSVSDLKKKSRNVYENYLKNQKLRPPNNLKLLVNADFIIKGSDVLHHEFDVLSTISDYSRVQDIYENCALLEYEITHALVSLRKKGAIKVLAGG